VIFLAAKVRSACLHFFSFFSKKKREKGGEEGKKKLRSASLNFFSLFSKKKKGKKKGEEKKGKKKSKICMSISQRFFFPNGNIFMINSSRPTI